jgi:outer membrane murein-binding lipoprotein Lpp
MLKKMLILGVILSVVLVSGCVQQDGTGQLTDKQIEDQAAGQLEQELDQAIEDIDLSDLESSIPE